MSGGMLNGGQTAIGMQSLVDAIRSGGATQVISVSAFDDGFDFQGFGPEFSIRAPRSFTKLTPTSIMLRPTASAMQTSAF
jgi:hypothetical protein